MDIKRADITHAEGISKVCSKAYRATYKDTHSEEYIERTIAEFYHLERIREEITVESEGWDGWFAAIEAGEVVGAIGGGMIGKNISEVFVLYLDPERRREGIGTLLLNVLTEVQKEKGATQQMRQKGLFLRKNNRVLATVWMKNTFL